MIFFSSAPSTNHAEQEGNVLTLDWPNDNIIRTMQEAIDAALEGRIDAARVQFYTAEIILALVHLHDLGLMYRDLKVCTQACRPLVLVLLTLLMQLAADVVVTVADHDPTGDLFVMTK